MRRGAVVCMTMAALLSGMVVASIPASGAASFVPPTNLVAVSCPSATRCFAVGTSFTKPSFRARTLIERWNGSSWAIVPSPNSASPNTWLSGIACTSATSCIAVGNASAANDYGGTAFVARMTGTTWSTVAAPTVPGGSKVLLSGVTCTSASSCFAVGQYVQGGNAKPLVERWNGNKWTIVAAAVPAGLQGALLAGVGCASAAKCFAVGGSVDFNGGNVAVIERWNGTRFVIDHTFKFAGGLMPKFSDISCPTATHCHAVGDDDSANMRTLAAVWNGSTWSVEPTKNRTSNEQNKLFGVSCWAAGSCLAVGESLESNAGPTHTLSERRSASGWSLVASPNKHPREAYLDAVSCIAANKCFAVGGSSAGSPVVILRWNGSSWSNVKPG